MPGIEDRFLTGDHVVVADDQRFGDTNTRPYLPRVARDGPPPAAHARKSERYLDALEGWERITFVIVTMVQNVVGDEDENVGYQFHWNIVHGMSNMTHDSLRVGRC